MNEETILDILDDMRRAGALMPAAYMRDLLNYADRIEAAAKRERAPVGNAAATREALVAIRDALCEHPYDHDDDALANIANAALSAPARQCDVGTAEEQEARYKMTGEVYHTLTLKNALAWAQTPYAAQEGAEDGKPE